MLAKTNRATADLRLISEQWSAVELTSRMGAEPTTSYERGDPRLRGWAAGKSFWLRGSHLPNSVPLEDHIEQVVAFAESRREALRSLAAAAYVDITSAASADNGPAEVRLDAGLCSRIGGLDVAVMFDISPPEREPPHAPHPLHTACASAMAAGCRLDEHPDGIAPRRWARVSLRVETDDLSADDLTRMMGVAPAVARDREVAREPGPPSTPARFEWPSALPMVTPVEEQLDDVVGFAEARRTELLAISEHGRCDVVCALWSNYGQASFIVIEEVFHKVARLGIGMILVF